MLLSQDKVTIICIVKFRIYNIAFTIKRQFWRQLQLKHGLYYTSDYETNICICYLLCFGRQFDPLKDLAIYTIAKFQHPTTFGWRDIEFRIWRLPHNFPWSKWPKTFCGRCRSNYHFWMTKWWSLHVCIILFVHYTLIRSGLPGAPFKTMD